MGNSFVARARISTARQWAAGLALALTVSMVAAPPAAAASVTEVEPNSTSAQAQSIPLATTVNSTFGTSGDCDNGAYDCDFYRVTLGTSGRVVIDLRFSDALGTDGKLDLHVLDGAGKTIQYESVKTTDYSGARVRGLALFAGPGTYYVSLKARVTGFSSNAIWKGQPYTLAVKTSAMPSESEPNSTSATADLLALGGKVNGSVLYGDSVWGMDSDYYRLPLTKARKISIDFRFPCGLGTDDIYDIEVWVGDEYLTTYDVPGGWCSGSKLRAKTIAAPAGNAYIMVDSSFGSGTTVKGKAYSLTVRGVLTKGTPTVSGTVKVGKTLTVKPGTWKPAPVALSYQWLRNGKPIAKATTASYKLTTADRGKKISVRVTGRKSTYLTASSVSASKTVL
ncbi:PPC domain-containing protein [Microbacterium terricola]|uniref:PPC domain-containing protein n=1 Tax=Microbacterium terricola TaxID=344163 RepID=UPI0021E6E5B1|nr:PPC domain-containing protein [Microbacterium terricola]UYK38685.1 PPC domain-containing protein [Microbacterium terricola]